MIISKPDKGNGSIVLDKTDYINKIYEIFGDSNKFDNIDKVKNEIVKILKKLLYTKKNNEDVYNFGQTCWLHHSKNVRLTKNP